jgi:tellurite resistance protein
MNLDHHLANTSRYAPTSLRARLAMALAAVVCSSVVLGTALGLFELQARAGMVAQVGNSPALGRGHSSSMSSTTAMQPRGDSYET